MYPVSEAYKEAMREPVQEWDLIGYIDAPGIRYQFLRENVIAGSFSIDNDISGQNRLELGSVTIGQLKATFTGMDGDDGIPHGGWKGLTIRPYFGLRLANGKIEYVPLGVFTIEDARHTEFGVEVTAYDNMAKLDKEIRMSLYGGIEKEFSVEDFARFKVTEDTAVIAMWEEKTCNVTYNGSMWRLGRESSDPIKYRDTPPQGGAVPAGTTITVPDVAGSKITNWGSYHFIGWALSPLGEVISGDLIVNDDITLYAQCTDKELSKIIIFDTGDEKIGRYSTQFREYIVTPPRPPTDPKPEFQRPDYTFLYWADKNGVEYDFTQPVTENTTFYAVWEPDNTNTVSFYDDTTLLYTQTVARGEFAVKPETPTKENVYFAQWQDAYEYDFDFTSTPITEDISLYASWSDTPVTVTFNANGGTSVPPVTVGLGGSVGEVETTRTGYAHKGWRLETTDRAAYDIASLACYRCGVRLGTTEDQFISFPNGSGGLYFGLDDETKTWRDILSWLAEICACYVTADRYGRIVFRQYRRGDIDPDDVIQDYRRWRGFSFADYATYYTAVRVRYTVREYKTKKDGTASKVWKKTVAEKRFSLSKEQDTGLTYDLGDNPFLREESADMVEVRCIAILDSLRQIRFVPFTGTVTGNPAYDLGDVLQFTGGIADDKERSVITQFVFTYGNGFKITGTGENPALQQAKSSIEKQVSSEENSESQKSQNAVLHFSNSEPLVIGDGFNMTVISATFKTSAGTQMDVDAQILLDVETTESQTDIGWVYNDAVATVSYEVDGTTKTEHPTETWQDGYHILGLKYTFMATKSNDHTLKIKIAMSGGQVSIATGAAVMMISGTGTEETPEVIPDEPDIPGVENPVKNITIVSLPDKTTYTAGEPLELWGVSVYKVYKDGQRNRVTNDCVYFPAEGATVTGSGLRQVTVTYIDENGITHREYFDITVMSGSGAARVKVTKLPTKTQYNVGDRIDYSGVVVTRYDGSGGSENVTSQCSFDPVNGYTVPIGNDVINVSVIYDGDIVDEFSLDVDQ